VNRLVGGIGERDDRHDMEDDGYLDSRTNRLQSRQVFTGNGIDERRGRPNKSFVRTNILARTEFNIESRVRTNDNWENYLISRIREHADRTEFLAFPPVK